MTGWSSGEGDIGDIGGAGLRACWSRVLGERGDVGGPGSREGRGELAGVRFRVLSALALWFSREPEESGEEERVGAGGGQGLGQLPQKSLLGPLPPQGMLGTSRPCLDTFCHVMAGERVEGRFWASN